MLVRHFIACQEVRFRDDDREDLLGVACFVEVAETSTFPCILSNPFELYFVASSVRKPTKIALEWVFLADQTYTYLWGSVTIPTAPCPADEIAVPLRLPTLPLRSAGQYEVRVWADQELVASLPLMVEKTE